MRLLRVVVLALLGSLVAGLAIGTAIRLRMEAPERYFIGRASSSLPSVARAPGNVGKLRTTVLDPRHHEQQIG